MKPRKDRSHDRADGISQSSIAIRSDVLKKLTLISEAERRSRNQQITLFRPKK